MPGQPGRAIKSKITAEVPSRSHTIAVGGTKSNKSLAIAAPTCTEMIPVITSHTAGIRSGSRTEPLCQTYAGPEYRGSSAQVADGLHTLQTMQTVRKVRARRFRRQGWGTTQTGRTPMWDAA